MKEIVKEVSRDKKVVGSFRLNQAETLGEFKTAAKAAGLNDAQVEALVMYHVTKGEIQYAQQSFGQGATQTEITGEQYLPVESRGTRLFVLPFESDVSPAAEEIRKQVVVIRSEASKHTNKTVANALLLGAAQLIENHQKLKRSTEMAKRLKKS